MTDKNYHDKSVILANWMLADGGKLFLQHIAEKKAKLLDRIARLESGIEVAAVEKKASGVTIVVLNKDEVQHELKFWKSLENEIKAWETESGRKGVSDD